METSLLDRLSGFSSRGIRIAERVIVGLPALDDNVGRHLQRGLLRRMSMMRTAINRIATEIEGRTEPLGVYLSEELEGHLNLYYLNLPGALDNLAWATLHHFNVFNPVDEDSRDHRIAATITGSHVVEALKAFGASAAVDAIENAKPWVDEIKTFRDPAAHRIPLHVPRTVLDENSAEEYRAALTRHGELAQAGDVSGAMDVLFESDRIGSHAPIFLTESPSIEVYSLPRQLDRDQTAFLDVVEPVVEAIAQSESS